MVKRVIAISTFVLMSFLAWHIHDLAYGIRQLYGQLNIIIKAKPIDYYLNNPEFDGAKKDKLLLIKEIKQFAIDSLGLTSNNNYSTVFDQKNQPILWVVSACERYSLKPFEWHFPLVGSFPYKGFFNKDLALKEAQKFTHLGMDADIRTVGGWSTLGWFSDPILSNMLNDSEGELANTIIHELTHGTLFVKDDVELNENLATFVGDEGAKAFLKSKYGLGSGHLLNYTSELKEEKLFVDYVIKGATALDSLYSSLGFFQSDQKAEIKKELIDNWIYDMDTTKLTTYGNLRQRLLERQLNNTFFAKYRRYHIQQDAFTKVYQAKFKTDLNSYLEVLFDKYRNI